MGRLLRASSHPHRLVQPVSNTLYGRRGLIPATPVLSLVGEPERGAPVGLEATEPEPDVLAALDRAGYGFDRAVDHAFWRRHARGTVWRRAGVPVAYSYAWPHGRIGPLAAVDGPAGAAALAAELERSRGVASLVVPGSAGELVASALRSGLRITGPPGLLLLSGGTAPPAALAISSYTLF